MWGTEEEAREAREIEQNYAFEVTCGHCGAVRLNVDPEDCCDYSGSSQSYRGADAARWDRHIDHPAG